MTGFPQLVCTTRDDVTPRLCRDGPGLPRQWHVAALAGAVGCWRSAVAQWLAHERFSRDTWPRRSERTSPHSIEFSGGVDHCSSKASRREDLEIEQPVACWDFASFDFHATLAGMLGPTLIRNQVIQVREPREKRRLAPVGMMEPFQQLLENLR